MKLSVSVFVMVTALIAVPAFGSYAAGGGIVVEDVGPYRDAPGTLQRMEINDRRHADESIGGIDDRQDMEFRGDSDGDGVADADDKCPATPRLIGTYDIGEMFSLEELTFRYMGLRGHESPGGERIVIHTVGVPAAEGGDQVCEIVAAEIPRASCVIEGIPAVTIILEGRRGTKIDIVVRHAVDETGCSPLP